MLVLTIPASIELVHAYEPHKHTICTSEIEHHFHENDVECVLCHLQVDFYTTINKAVQLDISSQIMTEHAVHYTYFKGHQHLSFSLRGPPQL